MIFLSVCGQPGQVTQPAAATEQAKEQEQPQVQKTQSDQDLSRGSTQTAATANVAYAFVNGKNTPVKGYSPNGSSSDDDDSQPSSDNPESPENPQEGTPTPSNPSYQGYSLMATNPLAKGMDTSPTSVLTGDTSTPSCNGSLPSEDEDLDASRREFDKSMSLYGAQFMQVINNQDNGTIAQARSYASAVATSDYASTSEAMSDVS